MGRRRRLGWKIALASLPLLALGALLVTWGRPRGRPAAPRASYVRSIGERGSGPGELSLPIGLAVSEAGEVFVSDAGMHRIAVFDPEGRFVRAFGRQGRGPGELQRPMHLSIGPDGLLYVAEFLHDRISVFRTGGTFVRHLTAPGLDAPAGVAVDPRGVAYVANFYGHNIVLVGPDGRLFGKWGQPGRVGLGALHYPTDVAVAPDGSLWIADAYNNRLQRFADGRANLLVEGFEVAVGVAVDRAGRVYGADFGHGQVRVFDADGTPLETFGTAGRGRGQFDRPQDIAVQGTRIYVADLGNHRVQEWRMEDAER